MKQEEIRLIKEAVEEAVKIALDSLGDNWVDLSFCNGAEKFEGEKIDE